MNIFVVGIGGFFGSCCRYLLTRFCQQQGAEFPFGTLLSNVIAALLIGLIIGVEREAAPLSEQMRLFLTTGLLGGLSTFSTFSIETVRFFENGKLLLAGGNILLNLALSLGFVFIGLRLAQQFMIFIQR